MHSPGLGLLLPPLTMFLEESAGGRDAGALLSGHGVRHPSQDDSCPALAFVPPADVESAFEILSDSLDKDLNPVLDHMELLQRQTAQARPCGSSLRFLELARLCPTRLLKFKQWSRRVALQLQVDGIKREIALAKMRRLHISTGKEGKQDAKYAKVTERMATIAATYDKDNVLNYLRSLAHVIEFEYFYTFKYFYTNLIIIYFVNTQYFYL